MRYLTDFAESHKNIVFKNLGVCEVDNVIFSRLSYLDFSAHTGKTIKDTAESFEYTADADLDKSNKNIIKTEELLRILGTTDRYKSVVISDFTELSGFNDTALSATVFKIADNTYYIAFRGTDDNITGIYEDAELAYSFPVPGQVAALSYTKSIMNANEGKFYLGGHSKGGNFALFSYAFLEDEDKERIIRVFNNDGPGFPKELVKILFAPEKSAKVVNINPEDSIVGRMLESVGKHVIIKSAAVGAGQHNVFTWITNGEKFERAEKFSAISEYMENTLTESLETISSEDMRKAAESIFGIAVNGGIASTKDINKKNTKGIVLALIQMLKSEDNGTSEISDVIKMLIKNLLDSNEVEKLIADSITDLKDKSDFRQQLSEMIRKYNKD